MVTETICGDLSEHKVLCNLNYDKQMLMCQLRRTWM